MAKTIEFKFDVGERVKTALGDTGIIDMVGFNGSENIYFVITSHNDMWMKETMLRKENE